MGPVTVYSSFDSLPAHFSGLLLGNHIASSVFHTPAWFHLMGQTLLSEGQYALRLYGVSAGEANALLLPMWHPIKNRYLATRHLQGFGNYYSCEFGPITSLSGPALDEALTSVIATVMAETPAWHRLDFRPMAYGSACFASFERILRKSGKAVQPYFISRNWHLEVEGRSYQQYYKELPSRLKNTLQRKSRQLSKQHTLRMDIITSDHGLEEAINAYQNIYAASWKDPEPYTDFIPNLIRLCAHRGWLRLGVAYIDGQAAAAQLWIKYNGVASIYKLAYDNQYAKTSVGSLLTACLMEYVMDEDKVEKVDFLNGDENYKKDWMSHCGEYWGLTTFNTTTLLGCLQASIHLGKAKLKDCWSSRHKQ